MIDAVLPHVIDIEEIDRSLLALLRQQLLTGGQCRQQHQSTGGNVRIVIVQGALIVRSEVIDHRKIVARGWSQFHDAVAVIAGPVPRAVTGGKVDVAARIGGGSAAAHPNAVAVAVRGCVEYSLQRQSRRVIGHDPTVPGVNVAMRTPTHYHLPVCQQQRRALILLQGVENHLTAAGVIAGSRYRGLDLNRAVEFLRQGLDIERMQVLEEAAVDLRRCHHIESPSDWVDYRSSSNPHFRHEIAAFEIAGTVHGAAASRYQAYSRIHGSSIRVQGIHAVVLGHNVENVVRAAGNRHCRQIQGLGVYDAVDSDRKPLAELSAVDVGWGEDGLLSVLPGPGRVVVVGRHVDLRSEQSANAAEQNRDNDASLVNPTYHSYLPSLSTIQTGPYPLHAENIAQRARGGWE